MLFEALPWIKNITGKTVVVKYGGAAMVDEKLRADVMSDIVLLKILGVNVVIVHGGGKAINRAFDALNFPVEFKDGQRVTTPAAMDVVRQVLVGEVNQDLVTGHQPPRQPCRGRRRLRCGHHRVLHAQPRAWPRGQDRAR